MKLENWETTAELNSIYADLRSNNLEQCIAEHDAFGFTVIPPEKVASKAFVERLRNAILKVHERRNGHRIDPDGLATATLEGNRPLVSLWALIGEDRIFEEAVLNPVVFTMARYLCGKSVVLSDAVALIKRRDSAPTHMLHIDQAGTPPPMPQYQQVLNITWALTEYTKDNGAVAIVPGSHRFGRMPMPYEENFLANDAPVKAVPIECEAGSLIIWGGTTWHASFPRSAPGLRVNLIMTFSRSYMKTVRDYRREISREVLDRNGPEFAQLMGMNALYPIDPYAPMDPKKRADHIASGRSQWM